MRIMSGIRGIAAGLVLLSWLGMACPGFAGDAALAGLAREAGMEAYPVPLKAPAFNLIALNGETRSLADYQDRVVLLNFWASWCPPCREEFPSLVRLHDVVDTKQFTVLAIAVRDSEQAVSGFLAHSLPVFDVLLDQDGATATAWHAAGVPVTYLLNRQGRLLAGKVGPLPWDSAAMRRLIRHVLEQP
jgi:thiol-disulfide isomerase/thioredoxin